MSSFYFCFYEQKEMGEEEEEEKYVSLDFSQRSIDEPANKIFTSINENCRSIDRLVMMNRYFFRS